VRLANITWQQAERVLTPDAVVVIPIGAAAKEHGPHLPLNNDFLLAERLADRVLARVDVVLAPTLNYHFYPAFVAYPGSTTLGLETARDVLADICRSLARHGPRRFYALNTGVSTLRALAPTAELLAAEGILLGYTDLLAALAPVEREVLQQEGGTHADEAETSMMLYLAPEVVDMRRAVKDYHPKGAPGFTRDPNTPGTYSPTGTWGDPTLATRAKGERLVAALVAAIVRDIDALRARPLPGA
jgi:creatinine amidohydrolase